MINNPVKLVSKQLIRMLLLVACVSVITFALVSISPIDPLVANVGQTALGSLSAEQIQNLEQYWGVDTPPVERYLNWAKSFLQGDMGISLIFRQNVSYIIGQKLSSSLILLVLSWVFSVVFGVIMGIICAVNQGKLLDKIIKSYCMIISSTPLFWLGLLLIIVFCINLGWFPLALSSPIGVVSDNISFFDKIPHAILPAITLSITGVSSIAIHTREKSLEILESDYILFAKARGENTFSIVKNHLLRNVSLPIITISFASIGEIFSGSILIEQLFSYPGLGQTTVASALNSDIPLLMGITVISSIIIFGGNLIANILYTVIDPRLKNKGGIIKK